MFDFFKKLFIREPPNQAQVQTQPQLQSKVQAVIIPTAQFSNWSGNAYTNDIFRAGVDAIARNAAKLKPVHTITDSEGKRTSENKQLQKILQLAPNPYMSTYDLIYKTVTQLFLFNNAFILIDWTENDKVAGFYPLNFSSVNFAMDADGNLYAEFTFKNGRKAQFSYSDLIHIRRHFNENEFLGDDNRALNPALELAYTHNEGIIAGIKNSGNLRGLLKLTQTSKATTAREIRDQFIKDYLNLSNNGGVAVLDASIDYIPLNNPSSSTNPAETAGIKEKIYNYLGITEKIVNSSYNEDEFAAFYESTVEPIATQLSLEFTRKIFSEREIAFGNQIIFESGRLQFTSNKTKVELIKELMPLGLLTINQALEILNIAPTEGGEKRLQTLNVVDFDVATQYQLARAGKENGAKNGKANSTGDGGANADET